MLLDSDERLSIDGLLELKSLMLHDQEIAACNLQISAEHFKLGQYDEAIAVLKLLISNPLPISFELRMAAGICDFVLS
jgi:hypothetical protein